MPILPGEYFSFDQMSAPPPVLDTEPQSKRQVSVVIMGGGLAGLTCAYRLNQIRISRASRPSDVIVLEREGQVGGRTRSLQIGSTILNLGALTFHPTQYPQYMQLLGDLGLADRIRTISRKQMVFGYQGHLVRADGISLLAQLIKALSGRQGLVTLGEAYELIRFYFFWRRLQGESGGDQLERLGTQSVAEWAETFGFSQDLKKKFVSPFIHYCFRKPEEVSAAFGVFLLGFNLSQPATLEGGFGQVSECMAAELDGLETNALVLGARRRKAGFEIQYLQDQHLHVLESRFLVVAVPATIAQQLIPEMGEPLKRVTYGSGHGTVIEGKRPTSANPELHLLASEETRTKTTITGGELRSNGNGQAYMNVLTYSGGHSIGGAKELFTGGFKKLLDYRIDPASAILAPGQNPPPLDWGDGLYLAGDCVGPFPSQETAVSSGARIAAHLNEVLH